MRYIIWTVALVAAGTAAIAGTVKTGPGGDFFDSPWLFGVLCGLALLSAIAGWTAPKGGPYWGLIAMAPFFIGFTAMLVSDSARTEDGLFIAGFIFLFGYTVLVWLPGMITGAIRWPRHPSR